MDKPYIEVRNVYFSYDQARVLNGVDLKIYKGEYVAVVGPNGSGKSTLAKHLNAILTPTSGEIIVDGVKIDQTNCIDARKEVGMVFQNPDNQLVATITEEDVAFAPENLGIPQNELRKRVDNALTAVGMLDCKDKAPHNLSGGQKQRVAIAGVLAMNPSCIVLDEATSMLDPRGKKEILDTIYSLNKNDNKTIINITHSMDEAAIADRIVVMNKGAVAFSAPPKEVFSKVDYLKKIGLDVPEVMALLYELSKEGIKTENVALTIDECVNEIRKILES